MSRRVLRPTILAMVVAGADWLFFGHRPGLSVAIFLVALAGGAVLANPIAAWRRKTWLAAALFAVAVLPTIENAGPLPCLLSVLAAAHFVLVATTNLSGALAIRIAASADLLLAAPFRCWGRLIPSLGRSLQGGAAKNIGGVFLTWTVPIVFSVIFGFLFAAANPVLDDWLADIRLDRVLAAIDEPRLAFWLAVASAAAPFVFLRVRRTGRWRLDDVRLKAVLPPEWVSGDATILRSLTVFNLLFAVQTAMDIQYLWRGAALPDGLTFADYAHRGAYPLVATALLAGGFVIMAMRPGSTAERSPLLRLLVFAWTAQNLLLVASSILRLKLYVEAYSLTYWRVAAFVWMFLVATGLLLIVGRIALDRSNAWLVSMNLAALAMTLYLCGFINFPAELAMYNVTHSRELSGSDEPLDVWYLALLGPQAVPAMDLFAAGRGAATPRRLRQCRDKLVAMSVGQAADWRAWSFRDWRLKRYLESKVVRSR